MRQKTNLNAVNQYPRGTNIYIEGEPISSIALVIKGEVLIYHEGAKYKMSSGSFVAVSDIKKGKYQSTYTALEDLIVYTFAIEHMDDLENIISINKDYNGFMIMSMSKAIDKLNSIYQDIIKHGNSLYEFLIDGYRLYYESASRRGYTARRPEWVEELTVFDRNIELDINKINYYRESAKAPIDMMKSFYSFSNTMTIYQLEDQIELINQLNDILKDYAHKLIFMSECLIEENDTCLFGLIAAYAMEIANADGNTSELMDNMDSIIGEIYNTGELFDKRLGRKMNINRKQMEEVYHLLITGVKDKEISPQAYLKYSVKDADRVISELANSYEQILKYSGIDKDNVQQMQEIMLDFVNLKDRFSTEDNARKIRKRLTEEHYILYKAVFLKAHNDKKVPRIIDMYLKYGYADERLLDNEQLLSLYFLNEEKIAYDIPVYNIKEWLTLIYEGKKEPSKNEFDLDYNEMLLSNLKKGRLTNEEAKQHSKDKERKLDYEIQNMFCYNNRIVNGQISTFVPVLHKDMLLTHPDKSYVTPTIIKEEFKKLLDIDYSIFDKEMLYINKELNIEKEYIIKRVYPDIILMPTAGVNAIMWQDITGKKRSNPGRFVFPIFCEANLFSNIVKVCGRFRWEMCRTIEGTAWNDIKLKSLTSEYSDYLQFYKKNRELSEDRKDKIKLQIQKGRNNSREIFVIDYEAWVNYESRGALKLNKLIRELMATYCPFSKEIRDQLIAQPIFEDAYGRYTRNKLKKIRETEGRYRKLKKENIELTKELEDTLIYYKES